MLNPELIQYAIKATPSERMYMLQDDFLHWFLYYYIDYIKYPFAPFHYEMFDDLQGLISNKYREVAFVMFRESAKTSIAKGFITWLICTNKRKYINVDSFD